MTLGLAVAVCLVAGCATTYAPHKRLSRSMTLAPARVCMTKSGDSLVYRLEAEPKGNGMALLAESRTTSGRPAMVVSLTFLVRSKTWRYASCHNLSIAGSGRYKNVNAERDGRFRDGGVDEMISWKMRVEEVADLLAAGRVRFNLCNDSGELPNSYIKALSHMIKAARTAATSLPACKK